MTLLAYQIPPSVNGPSPVPVPKEAHLKSKIAFGVFYAGEPSSPETFKISSHQLSPFYIINSLSHQKMHQI